MIFFLLIVLVLLPALHIYLWRRLIRDTMSPGRGRRIATAVLVTLVVVMLAAILLGTRTPPAVARWYAWPGYVWLALFYYLLVGLLLLEISRLALRRWMKAGDEAAADPPAGPTRRQVLARGSALVAGAAAAGLVGYGSTVALGPPTVNRVPITLRRLDPRAAGCRIALISDLHLGPILGRPFTQRAVDLINAAEVDLVAIVGDLVDGTVANLADATAPLESLRSTHGTFFVTGNHEYYTGYQEWVDYLPGLGITVLRNAHTTITHQGGRFDLAGINDATGYQWQDAGDVGAAVAGHDPERAVVLLAHQPVDLRHAVDHDVDLMLAGHTHGGQLTPFELLVGAQQGAVAGLYRQRNTTLFVTRGAGFWGPPVRVGAPPDITIVELRAS